MCSLHKTQTNLRLLQHLHHPLLAVQVRIRQHVVHDTQHVGHLVSHRLSETDTINPVAKDIPSHNKSQVRDRSNRESTTVDHLLCHKKKEEKPKKTPKKM